MTDFQYKMKRDEILENFTPDFEEKAKFRAYDRAVLEMLIRGKDVYELFEQALDTIWEQSEKIQALSLRQPPAPMIIQVTPEQFEEIKKDLKI